MDLIASINLLRLELTGLATIRGKKCLVIPIEENDIMVSRGEHGDTTGAYLQVKICEKKESSYGKTHYLKQFFSKEYREANAEAVKNKPYIGSAKPYSYSEKYEKAPEARPEEDDLPF